MRLSPALSNVCGGEAILSRPQVVKAVWAYIKDQQLQDPMDKRTIVCDDALKAIFEGLQSVTCFSMNKFFGKHLEQLD